MDLPKSTLQSQKIEPSRLPAGSYKPRGLPYGIFQPFDLIGDSDAWGNNQLNWTNLFLLNTFKGKINTPDESILQEISAKPEGSDLRIIRQLINSLSAEMKDIKELQLNTSEDLSRLQQKTREELRLSGFNSRISRLEDSLYRVESKLDKLLRQFAIPLDTGVTNAPTASSLSNR